MLGLRLGERPRAIVTTTPKRAPLLKRVLALPRCAATHGRTRENPHLPGDFRSAVEAMFGKAVTHARPRQWIAACIWRGTLW
jgi:phage terminase large subunit-like protein